VLRGVDEQHGDTGDVQKLGADRVLQLALLPLAYQRADDHHADERQQGERYRQADGEPPPER
jgi:hypothetical protein